MVDKTESRLKIIGFIGAVIGGFSTMAVGTWRTLKEHDKIHANEPKELTEKVEPETSEEK